VRRGVRPEPPDTDTLLTDLNDIADEIQTANILVGKTIDVHVGVVEHKHGFNHYVAPTKEKLYAKIAEFCDEYQDDAGNPEAYAKATTDQERVGAYFEDHDREWLTTSVEKLEV
jgi:hypothetical protein